MDSGGNSTRPGSSTANSVSYADIESGSSHSDLVNDEDSFGGSKQWNKGRNTTSRCITAVAVISFALSVFSVVCLGTVFCWFYFVDGTLFSSENQKGRTAESHAQVCLPCLQVNSDPLDSDGKLQDVWKNLEVRVENDTQICCAANMAQYAVLFQLILQRQQEVRRIAEILELNEQNNQTSQTLTHQPHVTAISAHLVFKPLSQRSGSGSTPNKSMQEWKSPQESLFSHLNEGVKLHDNRLYIQKSGHYFIYCQTLFDADSKKSQNGVIVSAYVRRQRFDRLASPDILLKSRHTQLVVDDRHSSYVGGVFHLHHGDSLYVEVSHPELVSNHDQASFFGLFKVGV